MASVKQEIGERLRSFGAANFKSMSAFARALGMRPQNLGAYLSGKRIPGNKMEDKLRALGCDIIWLQHGATQGELQHRFDEMIQKIRTARDVTEKEREILAVLRGFEIEDVYEFEQCFSITKAVAIKMEKLAKRTTSIAAMKKDKHQTKK